MSDRRHPEERRNADRRQAKRLSLYREVRFLSAASPTTVYKGHLEDVSTSGVRLMLERLVPQGEKLLIEVRDDERTLCNVTVQVVWIESSSAREHCIGCELLAKLTPRQMEQLKSAAVGASAVATSDLEG